MQVLKHRLGHNNAIRIIVLLELHGQVQTSQAVLRSIRQVLELYRWINKVIVPIRSLIQNNRNILRCIFFLTALGSKKRSISWIKVALASRNQAKSYSEQRRCIGLSKSWSLQWVAIWSHDRFYMKESKEVFKSTSISVILVLLVLGQANSSTRANQFNPSRCTRQQMTMCYTLPN